MAIVSSTPSQANSPERDNFRDFLAKDNVENISWKFSQELQNLQKDIENKHLSKEASSPDALLKNLDEAIEQRFDWWALHNESWIKQQIANSNVDAINKKFNDDVLNQYMDYIDEIKGREIQELIDYEYFQLNALEFDILKSSVTSSAEKNSSYSAIDDAPVFWDKSNSPSYKPESFHEFIDKDPNNRSYQTLSPLTRNQDIDANGNGVVTGREMRKAGILDRYRHADKDIRKAVETILNNTKDIFKRNDIRGINWDDMNTILGDLIHDYYTMDKYKDPKAFRDNFRDKFIDTDRYNKKWIGARKDINKILSILEEWLEDSDVESALKHLADMGNKAKNINIVGASNDLVLLQEGVVNKNNVFLFLCDFDSNGTVDSTQITKQRKNHSRRDTGSVMGLQLYQNIAAKANLDSENNIIDGDRTSAVIKNIMLWVKSKSSPDSQLRRAIDSYEKKQDERRKWYSIESFLDFMSGKTTVTINKNEVTVAWVSAVKSYFESLAQESNEWSGDVSDVFVSPEQRQETLQEKAETAIDISSINNQVDKHLAAWWADYGEADLAFTRRTISDKILGVMNWLTDTLYLNVNAMYNSKGALAWDTFLANIFHGAVTPSAVGAIRQSFYFPDGTRNQQRIHNELWQYINKKVIPNFIIASDKSGNPILGTGVGTNKVSGDLTKRFQFNFNIGATLPVLNWANGEAPTDLMLGVAIDIEKTRQTKKSKAETKNQNTRKIAPATRVWLSVGARYEFIRQQIVANAWPVWDRDFPAGIEQKWREFHYLLTTLLDPSEHNFTNGNDYSQALRNKIGRLAKDNENFAANKAFLDDLADALWQKMEWAGVFPLLQSSEYRSNPWKKQQLLNFFYNQFIDWFRENAINQNLYNQLAGQWAKVTKVNIWAIVWTSVAAIALAPITGWLSLASLAVAWSAWVRFSTFRNSFSPDRNKTHSNYEKTQTHKNMEQAPAFTSLKEAAKHLEQQLNVLEPGKQNIVQVRWNTKDGTFRISLNAEALEERNLRADSILSYLNIYYAPDALDGFRFENGELILGQADLHVGRIVQKDAVEFHLMLGTELSGMTKLNGPVGNTENLAWYEKTPAAPAPLTKEKTEELVTQLGLDNTEQQEVIDFIWKTCDAMPEAVTRWALSLKKYPDGKYKLLYERNEDEDVLKLSYEVVTDISQTEWKEVHKSSRTIDLWAAFEYINTSPNDYEKLRNNLDRLGEWYKHELYKTADIARKQNPDLLYAFLEPLSVMDYNQAAEQLIKVLEKWRVAAYNPFIEKLKDTSLPENQRILICNKFKHLLAYNATSIKLLTAETYSNISKLWWLIDRRKNAYEAMAREKNMPSIFRPGGEYYNALRNKTKDWTSYEIEDAHNTIWYTAFYRTAAKHFGIAHPGETKIVKNGSEVAKVNIDQTDDKKTAYNRYFKQLANNPKEFAIIQKAINQKLKAANTTYRIDSLDDFKKLIGGKVEHTWINTTIKENLTFNSKFVLYLMWECTNESLWLELGELTITQEEEVTIETVDDTQTKEAKIVPGKTEEKFHMNWASGLYNNEYDIQSRQRDLTIAAAASGRFKQAEPFDDAGPGGQNPPGDTGGPDGENPGWVPNERVNPDGQNPNWTPPGDNAGGGWENG